MSQVIIEKLDAIEAANAAKIAEVTSAATAAIDTAKNEMTEKISALEAKISTLQMPAVIKVAKTVTADVNRSVKEQLRNFYKGNNRVEKELVMFADESQYVAFQKEASALTGSGAGAGGRTGYDPVFAALRLLNPMRGLSRQVSTDGSTYQFRSKVGNAGAAWGYSIQNNGALTTQDTNIWQLTLQDLNVQFPIRTAALDDIDGLEGNVVSDMLAEFSQAEAINMITNNDQGSPTTSGGSNGLRGLNQYPGANATYTGGTTSTAAFGTTGTGSSSGLHSLATYDQITTNGNALTNNVVFKDIVNFVYALPQQYWSPSTKFMISPLMLSAIRGLIDDSKTPIFERMAPLVSDGIVGKLLGFDVVVNNYVNVPSLYSASAGTDNLYPMFFGDWERGHTIVDRLNMVMRRYDQTLPGSITFYGEKRLCTSVVNPFAIVRYRSTKTASL